ncbi:MAG TPA: DUF2157 domain-containing protein [Acidobacteriota bacterium]|nr:DUF2157 domain-containing protein [Acidobacteriota bacterium]
MADANDKFTSIFATIGAILIGLGVVWLLATNWHSIPALLKVLILVAGFCTSFYAGFQLEQKEFRRIAQSLYFLGSIIFCISVFLIAQIFNTDASVQGAAVLSFIAAIGTIIASYIFISRSSLVVGMFMGTQGFFLQFLATLDSYRGDQYVASYAILAFALAMVIYGVSLYHRAVEHIFEKTYLFWSTFYVLLFGYILSYQWVLIYLWRGSANPITGFITFMLILGALALAFGIYSCMQSARISASEITSIFVIIIAFAAFLFMSNVATADQGTCRQMYCGEITSDSVCNSVDRCMWNNNYCSETYSYCSFNYNNQTGCTAPTAKGVLCEWQTSTGWDNKSYSSCVSLQRNNQYVDSCTAKKSRSSCSESAACTWSPGYSYSSSYRKQLNTPTYLLWIVFNIAYIALILAMIALSTIKKHAKSINLCISFFVLFIITRYIGFIMDFGGYTSLAFVFIIGGVLLIGGAILIRKWHKKLMDQVESA